MTIQLISGTSACSSTYLYIQIPVLINFPISTPLRKKFCLNFTLTPATPHMLLPLTDAHFPLPQTAAIRERTRYGRDACTDHVRGVQGKPTFLLRTCYHPSRILVAFFIPTLFHMLPFIYPASGVTACQHARSHLSVAAAHCRFPGVARWWLYWFIGPLDSTAQPVVICGCCGVVVPRIVTRAVVHYPYTAYRWSSGAQVTIGVFATGCSFCYPLG